MKTSLWLTPTMAISAAALAGCAGGGGTSALTPAVTVPAAQSSMTGDSVSPLATSYISKAKAEQIALAAVHGGVVTLAVLETNDRPVHWSIDITNRTGDYEVWVDARTGKVLAIIKG